jgi:hypothetical protein
LAVIKDTAVVARAAIYLLSSDRFVRKFPLAEAVPLVKFHKHEVKDKRKPI